ncbi:MAG: PEP-utilizing enzyme [Myxococcota bacterium]
MADGLPRRLHDGLAGELALPPKARTLAVLAAAGLPVPDGWIVEASAAVPPHVTELVRLGPVVVRSCGDDEDGAVRSGAGLGSSTRNVRDPSAMVAAIAECGTPRVIVQAQARGRWLVVAASTEVGIELEVHALPAADAETPNAPADTLAGGATPAFTGACRRWPPAARVRLAELITEAIVVATTAGEHSDHGWDLELVVDDDAAWVVQLRPLTAALHPGWPAFVRAVEASDPDGVPDGRLTLDAEHNPAPLSVAHAWVIEALAAARGKRAGAPRVLAGWLYLATLPRDLGRDAASQGPPPMSAHDALVLLQRDLLPKARQRLVAIEASVHASAQAPLSPSKVRDALDHAWAAFLTMIDAYTGTLVPARRAAAGMAVPIDTADPLTLRQRDRYLDVLPAVWDIASPTLADLGARARPHADPPAELPTDPARAAALLGEWDDHLFALGMAPLRRVFLAVAAATELGDDVFLLRGPELVAALEGTLPDVDARRQAQQRYAALTPPRTIDAGQPVADARRRWGHGIPIGPTTRGRATVRHDLAALLSEPPGADAVVMIPALTAPAAVALQSAGVRSVCSEFGGPLSHGALMARELGLSALIGCRGCTDTVEGAAVVVDTIAGRLRLDGASA